MILVLLLFIFQTFFGGVVMDFQDFHDAQASVSSARGSVVRFSDVQFHVEVADSVAERARGLMFRNFLGKNNGMLFIFEDEGVRNFWMKNTLIPLDMIFVNSEGKVVSMRENVQPCRNIASSEISVKNSGDTASCPVYSSGVPARYVLEINAGLAQIRAIQPGMRMDIQIM